MQWLWLVVLGSLLAACGAPEPGEACREIGEPAACVAGAVCVADPDPVCRAVCESSADCDRPRFACSAAEGCGDGVRACQRAR